MRHKKQERERIANIRKKQKWQRENNENLLNEHREMERLRKQKIRTKIKEKRINDKVNFNE